MNELPEWKGECPVYLIIVVGDVATIIDLDTPQWMSIHKTLMEQQGRWYLASKTGNMLIGGITIGDEEVPYYMARHVGIGTMAPGEDGVLHANEIVAYGIGKYKPDGSVDRLWFMSNGFVCMGDDLESFAIEWIKRGVA